MSADTLAADEDLRCRLDVVLGFERVGFFARCQPAVLDSKALALEQVERFRP